MERVVQRKTVTILGDFIPAVAAGSSVRPGSIVGMARIPKILEEYPLQGGEQLLVDDGVFVVPQTPLFKLRKGSFRTDVMGALHEGIVRVHKGVLRIVSDDIEEEVKATVWGKIISVSEDGYEVECRFLKMPIFVSQGTYAEGTLEGVFQKGLVVASHHLPDQLKKSIVVLPGALTYETYLSAIERGAVGIIAPSIDWGDYTRVFRHPFGQIGILHGFGMFPLWRWYYDLLSKLQGVSISVDFAHSFLYVPISDILLGSLSHELLLFKEHWWGKQVKELIHESGDIIAHLETGEQTPVSSEELFNIR